MDNAGSTNKNQYVMAAALEIVQQRIMDYLRISFMIAGHTKFVADPFVFPSDVFNESELIAVMEKHSTAVFDKGRIMRAWRKTVANKYSNLPGI